jgi:hypothetical protein
MLREVQLSWLALSATPFDEIFYRWNPAARISSRGQAGLNLSIHHRNASARGPFRPSRVVSSGVRMFSWIMMRTPSTNFLIRRAGFFLLIAAVALPLLPVANTPASS